MPTLHCHPHSLITEKPFTSNSLAAEEGNPALLDKVFFLY